MTVANLSWKKDPADTLRIGWWIRSDGKIRIQPRYTALLRETYWELFSVLDGSTGGELGLTLAREA